MSVLGKIWKMKIKMRNASLRETLLQNRNLRSEKERKEFFEDTEELHDPFKLGEMAKAVGRMEEALQKKHHIRIFGDYDVDGMSGAAIFVRILRTLRTHVSYRIPHRLKEGYGLTKAVIDECKVEKVNLLITVDCGITAHEEIAYAKKHGIDVIVTDHHVIPKKLPKEACAIVHPSLPKFSYPFHHLTGSAVAYKCAQALVYALIPKTKWNEVLTPLLDLAAMGVVADMAPLTGENRTIVRRGLRMLKDTHHRGLQALKEKAGVADDDCKNTDIVGFRLAPRLNAASRLENPLTAFELLIDDGEKSEELAAALTSLNTKRQDLTKEIVAEIEERHENTIFQKKIIIDWKSTWPIGVLGLVAGRFTDRYGRPIILLEDRGEELWGSGRSIPEFHLTEALTEVSHLLEHFGGHAQACGFRVKKKNFKKVIDALEKKAEKTLSFETLLPTLDVECPILPEEIDFQTLDLLDSFEPFGMGNPRPCFLMEQARILYTRPVGKEGNHLQLLLLVGQKKIPAIGFNFGKVKAALEKRHPMDLVVELMRDRFQGEEKLKLRLVDAR